MADKLLRSIKFPTLPDRYVIGDSTLTEEGAAAEAKAVGEALATKADTKGTYEDLIVGGAEQLMADEYETDKDPYLFRTTGGSADVGNREYLDSIVGGTVAWNQLVPISGIGSTVTVKGVTFTNNNDGSVTINGTATDTISGNDFRAISSHSPISGHKYLFSGCPSGGSRTTYFVYDGYAVRDLGDGTVAIPQLLRCSFYAASGTVFNNAKFVPQIFDITAMFGTTIADYIYSLEQAHAGDGVAWFKKLFPKPYYAYNAGELMSVQASSHDMVGFNAWDEEWELGLIAKDTGGNVDSSLNIRSKNFIPVIPSTNYYYLFRDRPFYVAVVVYYDKDKKYIGSPGDQGYCGNVVLKTPDNCHYVRFYCGQSYGTTYNHDICINLSDPTRNGEYEPYVKHTYPLDSSLTLRGVPKLVDWKLAFDGDVYLPSGEVQRRYGIVDLGTLDWRAITASSSRTRFRSADLEQLAKKVPSLSAKANALCSCFELVDYSTGNGQAVTGVFALDTDADLSIWVSDSTYADATAFKTAMSGHTLVYELATPTTETADGYEQYQRCDPSGTEEFVTTGIVPVGHETRYPHDLKKKIETAPDSPSTDGTYLMKRSGGKNTYMALPSTPSANGAYVLTVTVSGGTASYSWTAKE